MNECAILSTGNTLSQWRVTPCGLSTTAVPAGKLIENCRVASVARITSKLDPATSESACPLASTAASAAGTSVANAPPRTSAQTEKHTHSIPNTIGTRPLPYLQFVLMMNATNFSDNAKRRVRLPGVDILRGLAIFYVLMNHVNMRLVIAKVAYTNGIPTSLVNSLVWNAQYAVQVFFSISGFLITWTTLARWGSISRINVRDFYALRLARIGPLLILLLAVLSCLHLIGLPDFVVSERTGGLSRALLAAATFSVNVLEANRGYLPANWDILWSLSVEEMFYLFFPLLCRILKTERNLLVLLIVFVLLGPFGRTAFARGNEVWQEYSYLGGMDAIAIGCITALTLAHVKSVARSTLRALGTVGVTSLLFIFNFSPHTQAFGLQGRGLDMTIVALATCLVITVAAYTQWDDRAVFKPIVKLGQQSYEIYLTHMFVVFWLFDSFAAKGSPIRYIPLLFISTILASGALGELVARIYSVPLNHLLRRHSSLRLSKVYEASSRGESQHG